MSSFADKVAGGALWMVGFKFTQRFIGIISTIILARLLIPEDFGLVAMAMAFYAFIWLIGSFGFDMALIQNQDAERHHYNAAWTLNVGYGFISAILLVAAAPLLTGAFDEPRLQAIVYAFAAIAVVQGFENIGIVAFRKELQFDKEFLFQVAKKVVAFVVTVTLAFALRSYWALVIGIMASRLTGVTLSYWLHPYRPWFGLRGTRDLFSFSGWIVINNLATFAKGRGPDFVLARLAGAGEVGLYRISKEISNLPTTELTRPIMRAVFPGYAKIAKDPERLRKAFLDVQGTAALVTIPAGLTVVALADPLVRLVLGSNWLDAIPLIQVLGIYGVIMVLKGTSAALFLALGVPYWVAVLALLETALALPMMAWLLTAYDLQVAVWAFVASGLAMTPVVAHLYKRLIGVTLRQRLALLWRPLGCGTVMAIAAWWGGTQLPVAQNEVEAAVQLAILLPVAGIVFLVTILGAWRLSGAPKGPETRAWEIAQRVMPPLARVSGYLARKPST